MREYLAREEGAITETRRDLTLEEVKLMIEDKVSKPVIEKKAKDMQADIEKDLDNNISKIFPVDPINVITTTPFESDDLLVHSPELAEKYKTDALIANLTQASSPKPLMKTPRYARVLIFPILNEKGDVRSEERRVGKEC